MSPPRLYVVPPRPPSKPNPALLCIGAFFWTPFALVLGGLGLLVCITVIGIPIGLVLLLFAGWPYALMLIKYNKSVVAYNMHMKAVQDAQGPRKEHGHIVRPWDVSVTMGDTTAYEGWYNDVRPGPAQGTTGRGSRT